MEKVEIYKNLKAREQQKLMQSHTLPNHSTKLEQPEILPKFHFFPRRKYEVGTLKVFGACWQNIRSLN